MHLNPESQGWVPREAMCLLMELTALYLLLFWINPALSADSSLSDHPVIEWWHQWLIWEEFTLFFINFVMMFIRRGLHEVPGSCSVENSQWHTCNLCGHFRLISASLLPFLPYLFIIAIININIIIIILGEES